MCLGTNTKYSANILADGFKTHTVEQHLIRYHKGEGVCLYVTLN